MFTMRQLYVSPMQRLDGETEKQYYIRMRQQQASGVGRRAAHARHSVSVATQKRDARKRRNIRARAPKH